MCGHERKDALFRIFPVQIGDVPAVPFGKDRSLLDHDEPLVRADQRLERRTVDIVQRNMPGTERQYRIGKCNRRNADHQHSPGQGVIGCVRELVAA